MYILLSCKMYLIMGNF